MCGRPRRYRSCSSSAPRPTHPAPRCRSRSSARRRSAPHWYNSWRRRRRSSSSRTRTSSLLLFLPLAQIILGRAHRRAWRRVRIETRLGGRDGAAVLAHLEQLKPAGIALVHPVLAGELLGHAFNRAPRSERLAAAHAGERLLLLDDTRQCGRGAEIDLRLERDHLLGTGRLAETALHAGVLGKLQGRLVRIVTERAGRAGRHAGEAERAAGNVDIDRAERRALR